MELTLYSLMGVALLVGAGVLFVPRKLRFENTVEIDATAKAIFEKLQYQRYLPQWSSWAEEKPSSAANCYTEGTEGAVGSVFFYVNHKHKKGGSQVLESLLPDKQIVYRIQNLLGYRPTLTFTLAETPKGTVKVNQVFEGVLPRPLNLLFWVTGFSGKLGGYFVRDLQLQKRLVETGVAVPAYQPKAT